jgi:hypothetical protein
MPPTPRPTLRGDPQMRPLTPRPPVRNTGPTNRRDPSDGRELRQTGLTLHGVIEEGRLGQARDGLLTRHTRDHSSVSGTKSVY